MDLPNVNPGDIIKAADINNISSSLEYLDAQVHGGSTHTLTGAATIGATVGHHEIDLTGNCSLTINRAGAGTHPVVSLDVLTSGHTLTVIDSEVPPITEDSIVGLVWSRGAWKGGSGGGSTATPDTTPASAPTAVSVSTVTDTTARVTYTAGTDPESTVTHHYSLDGGATWLALGSSPATITGLTASTVYNNVQVAAKSRGGWSASVAVPSFTTATPDPAPDYTIWESFARPDGTNMEGVTAQKGGVTLFKANSESLAGGGPAIVASGAIGPLAADPGQSLGVTIAQQDAEISVDYALSASTSRVYLAARKVKNSPAGLAVMLDGSGILKVFNETTDVTYATGVSATGWPVSGRLSLRIVGTTATVTSGDKTATWTLAPNPTGTTWAAGVRFIGSKVDNLGVKYL